MASQYDLTIVGGGILGLATALKITAAHPRLRLLLLEKEPELARHQTGNNSGVIHSGLYYRPGSLKARTCVAGRKELIAFCDENSVPYEICGKVVVATTREELPRLEEFRPQMLFVSAGFDAHRDDDLGQLGLVEADYRWLTERIKDVAERHAQGRIVSCLEGGYALDALARSVEAHLRVLAGV